MWVQIFENSCGSVLPDTIRAVVAETLSLAYRRLILNLLYWQSKFRYYKNRNANYIKLF